MKILKYKLLNVPYMLETIFLWGLYLVLPTVLLYHFLGPEKAGLIFAGIIALHQTNANYMDDLNQIRFPIGTEADPTIILARSDGSGNRGRPQKFDIAFHRKLEKEFPDWNGRIALQQKQEKLYRSAMKRQRELMRTGLIDRASYYTKAELDAIAYFKGTGFYSEVQDSVKNPKPCKYDTRQSFLIKMHDDEIRRDFLKSFNRLNS